MDSDSILALLSELKHEQTNGNEFAVKALIFYIKQILNSYERGETSLYQHDVITLRNTVDQWILRECRNRLEANVRLATSSACTRTTNK